MQKSGKNPHLAVLAELIIAYTKLHKVNVSIYLYGSRAKGKERATSDVDLALLPEKPLPPDFMSNLRELIEESTIPYTVDLIDLSQTDATFREKILTEALQWKD